MAEITVRRCGGRVVMMLMSETNPDVEVTLESEEAAALAALLLRPRAGTEAQIGIRTPQARLLALDGATLRANARRFQSAG